MKTLYLQGYKPVLCPLGHNRKICAKLHILTRLAQCLFGGALMMCWLWMPAGLMMLKEMGL